jgi:hypothetical protein
MKIGRRPRCSSITYQFRYARALLAAHFDRNKIPRISGTGHWHPDLLKPTVCLPLMRRCTKFLSPKDRSKLDEPAPTRDRDGFSPAKNV